MTIDTKPKTPQPDPHADLERMYPKRSLDEKRMHHELGVKLAVQDLQQERKRDRLFRAMCEAIVVFAFVDLLFFGFGWNMMLANVVIGAIVGWLWHVTLAGDVLAGCIGTGGYLISLLVFGVPSHTPVFYWYILACAVVWAVCLIMARQRQAMHMGM